MRRPWVGFLVLLPTLTLTACRFEEETPIQWVRGRSGCVEVGQRGQNLRLAQYAPGSADSFYVQGCHDRVAAIASSDPAIATFDLEQDYDLIRVTLTPVGVGDVDAIFLDAAGNELDRFGFTIEAPASLALSGGWVGDRPLVLVGAPLRLPWPTVLDAQGEAFWNYPTVTWEATTDATMGESEYGELTVTALGAAAAVTCTSGDASAVLGIDTATPEDLTDLQLINANTIVLGAGAGGGFYGVVWVTLLQADRVVYGAGTCQWDFSAEPREIRTFVDDGLYGDGKVIMHFFFDEVATVDATCTLGALQESVQLSPPTI